MLPATWGQLRLAFTISRLPQRALYASYEGSNFQKYSLYAIRNQYHTASIVGKHLWVVKDLKRELSDLKIFSTSRTSEQED